MSGEGIGSGVDKGIGHEPRARVPTRRGVVDMPADENVLERDDQEVLVVEGVPELRPRPFERRGALSLGSRSDDEICSSVGDAV